ncbi:amino acid permease [Natrinema ejinorense]|uniref:Amino acid transporter n=1 Tax=Natrinema ejinorense TaxID=373386 RepID=A0A2A5QUI2_9EURY|nr:amino acid permease [Natrinema ejinorense]PCR90419.1 amino acid transporter [Natrinema ejinorense]
MSDAEQELARDLGFLEAYTIGLGTMIGAGIFVLPSIAADQAGPASMISFFVGGLVSLLAALSLSELATGMPKAGGSYYYVNRALGPLFGSIVGWGMWAGLTFASAFYMIGFGQYLLPGLGQYIDLLAGWGDLGITVAALVMAAFLTGVNYYGVKETGALQNVIVITLVGLILAFLGFGASSGPSIGEFNPYGWPAVAATVGTVYVTFIGFEVIATSAEEIKNPSRNLPLAMIASVVTPTLLYVGVMFVSTGTLSLDALVESPIPVADVATAVMSRFGMLSIFGLEISIGSLGALAMIVGAVLATVSSANASILSAARVNFAMGRDRILINWLNEVHSRFRTPYRSITATGIITLVLIAIGVGIGTLAEVASFMYLVTYALVHVAVVVLRRANPESYEPSFRIPTLLYPVVPIVGMLACLAVLVQMAIDWVPAELGIGTTTLTLPVTPTPVGIIGVIIVGAGLLWYHFYARERALSESLVGEAIAPERSPVADGEGRYRVVVPVANPETERDLLRMAAASAHAHDAENAEVIAMNVIEVPQQTSLSQNLAFEEERVERQQQLLDAARDIAADLDVGLRTRAIVGRDAGSAILDVIEDEDADHVLIGWQGTRSARDHVLGSTIDPVIGRAACDATLVKLGPEGGRAEGDIMVLAGEGPHAPVAARRAAEFVSASDDASLTLFNVQPPADDDTGEDLIQQGEVLIDELAQKAGIEYMTFDTRVEVAENVERAILDATDEYDTICVGATQSGTVSQAVFGSLPENIGEHADGTVVMARGPEESPMSIREAITRRLEV